MGGEYRRVSPPLRDKKKNFQGSNMVKTTYPLERESIYILFAAYAQCFGFIGLGREGAAARMREEVRKRGRTTPGFYNPGTVSGREVFRGLIRIRRGDFSSAPVVFFNRLNKFNLPESSPLLLLKRGSLISRFVFALYFI